MLLISVGEISFLFFEVFRFRFIVLFFGGAFFLLGFSRKTTATSFDVVGLIGLSTRWPAVFSGLVATVFFGFIVFSIFWLGPGFVLRRWLFIICLVGVAGFFDRIGTTNLFCTGFYHLEIVFFLILIFCGLFLFVFE